MIIGAETFTISPITYSSASMGDGCATECGCLTITSSSDLAGETTPTATYLTPINGSLQIVCDLSSYAGMSSVDMSIVVTVTASNTNGDTQSFTFTILAIDC